MRFGFVTAMILLTALLGCANVTEPNDELDVIPFQHSEFLEIPFPHPEGWENYLFHGNYSLTLGKGTCTACHGDDFTGVTLGNTCTACHGDDFTGGILGTSCYSCHTLYPHASDWALISGHGNYLKTTNFNNFACATNCHGIDFTGGGSQVSCFSCHSLYPHSTDWAVTPDAQHPHADYVEANGDAACINCHVDIKAPFPLSNPQCQYCH